MSFSNFAAEKLKAIPADLLSEFHKFDQKAIILTGATGFFGTWLLALFEVLHDRGIRIEISAISRRPVAYLEKEPRFRNAKWLQWFTSDLTQLNATLAFSVQSDYIIHAGTDTSPQTRAEPAKFFWSITDSWRSVLALARKTDCSRILLVSSGAVYGAISENGARESDSSQIDVCKPPNPYALGKQVCEQSAHLETKHTNLDIVIARCFSFVGPGLPLNQGYAVGNFVRDIVAGQSIRIKGDGKAIRSYLHPCDLVIWLLTILLKGNRGDVYNVGSDQKITIAKLAHLVRDALQSTAEVVIEGGPSAGIGADVYFPQTQKIKSLGLDESCTLKQSVIELANSVKPVNDQNAAFHGLHHIP
jgi:nucleoside-diphosphate-sugar epimerase